MRHRFAVGSAALLLPAVVVGLTISAPRLLGQTQSSGPFGYVRTVDSQRAAALIPPGLPNGPVTAAQVLRGRYEVVSRDCAACHNRGKTDASDPRWLAGYLPGTPGQPFQIGPFKTYPANLTPDPDTGLGKFSDRQIFNAIRFGLDPEKTPDVVITSSTPGQGNFPAAPVYLAPPMPWPFWRYMTDEDLWAVVAYIKHGIKPVSNTVPASEGPPDHWASAYTAALIGPYPLPAYPEGNETFLP